MDTATGEYLVDGMNWETVRARLAAGAPTILPVGAGTKEHGLHLPLGTDAVQAKAYALHAARRCHGLVWPTMTYGHYPAFTAYAGSTSLEAATFARLVLEVLNALLSQTRSYVLVIDTGKTTIDCVRWALTTSSDPARVCHVPIYDGAHFQTARAHMETQSYGTHADEIETSIMLALAPEVVDMRRARASPQAGDPNADGPLEPNDANSPLFAPSGSWGDPTRASRAKGGALLSAIYRDLDDACVRMAPFIPHR